MSKQVVTDDDILNDIQRVSEEVDGNPAAGEYRTHGSYSMSTVRSHFGTWVDAKKAAGVGGALVDGRKGIPEDELLDDLRRVAEEVGAPPKNEEYTRLGEFSVTTFQERYGSWNEARREAGLDPYTRREMT